MHTTFKNQLSRLPTTNPSLRLLSKIWSTNLRTRTHNIFLRNEGCPFVSLCNEFEHDSYMPSVIRGNSHYYWSSFLFPADCQQWKYQVIPTTNVHFTFAINYLHLPQFSSLSSDPSSQSDFESHSFLASTHWPLSQMYSSSLHFADKRRSTLTQRTQQYKGHCQPAFHQSKHSTNSNWWDFKFQRLPRINITQGDAKEIMTLRTEI